MVEIQLYRTLRGKLGDTEAQELVSFIKSEINSEFMDCKQVFLTKEDKIELLQTIKQSKTEILEECKKIFLTKDDKLDIMRTVKDDKLELLGIITETKLELLQTIKENRVDTMRSVYIVGLVQFLAIVGAILSILSFFPKHP